MQQIILSYNQEVATYAFQGNTKYRMNRSLLQLELPVNIEVTKSPLVTVIIKRGRRHSILLMNNHY